ncbi:MAG: 50S ribosomal protein L5 [Cytophagales bacterium]|jgi:large subunit ribosomal protein L5|nr:50S ribosomal protein L5 [Cytophagales bacterium]
MIANLQKKYKEEIVESLTKKFDRKNFYSIPKIEKICINQGIGGILENKNLLKEVVEDLSNIAGQKAVVAKTNKAIANFKFIKGVCVGVHVTLRRQKMYEFLERLILVVLPRIRDFSGVSKKGFDGHGNYNLGIREQIVFNEVNIDKVAKIFGMNITMVINSNNDDESYELLKSFGIPFFD